MPSKRFSEALRKKFAKPEDVLKALGMDSALLSTGTKMTKKPPTQFAKMALDVAIAAIKPVLAKDAKFNLMPVFEGVTSKNWDAKKVAVGIGKELKGKLAKDAAGSSVSMQHVAKMLDAIEAPKSDVADASVSKEQHGAMEAAAHGHSDLGIPKDVGEEFAEKDKGKTFDAEPIKAFLKEKGMSEDDVHHLLDMMPDGMDAEPNDLEVEEADRDEDSSEEGFGRDADFEEEDKTAEKEKGEADLAKKGSAKDKAAKDKFPKAKDKKGAMDTTMVSKQAMDAAIKAATEATTKKIRDTERGIRLALDEVKPWVGELPTSMAFDSGEQVKRQALKMLGVDDADTIHESALSKIIAMHPRPGARPAERGVIAQDSAGGDNMERLTKKFGAHFGNIGVGNC